MRQQILRGVVLGALVAGVAIGVFMAFVDGAGEQMQSVLARYGLVDAPAPMSQPASSSRKPSTPDQWTPRRWRDHVASQYRLPPDRRYRRALVWLRDETITVEARDRGWRVRADGRNLAELPEAPAFDDLYASLQDAAWPDGAPDRQGAIDPSPAPLHVERLLDTLAASGDAETLRADPASSIDAAVAVSRLLLVVRDPLEIGDALDARALATLALVESAGADLPLERSIVAHRMGYSAAAARIAGNHLPPTHPWRAWLERRAIGDSDSALATWLRLRDAADRRESDDEWLRLAHAANQRDDFGPLVTLLSAEGLSRFGIGLRTQSLVPFAAFATATGDADTFDLAGIVGFAPIDPENVSDPGKLRALLTETVRQVTARYRELHLVFGAFPVAGFERALEAHESDSGKGQGIHATVLRTIFYGAVDRLVDLQLFARDNMATTRLLIDELEGQPGEMATALAVLYSQHLQVESGALQQPGPLLAELQRLPLGPRPLARTLQAALERSSWREGVRADAFRRHAGFTNEVAERGSDAERSLPGIAFGKDYPRAFDSRPFDRQRLLSHAEHTLYRPLLAEDLRTSIAGIRGRQAVPAIALERARRIRDVGALVAFAEDDRLSRAWRARAALRLSELGETGRADALFAGLVTEDAGDWEVREDWIESLHERGEYRRARELAIEWLEKYGRRRGTKFDVDDAVIAVADSDLGLGDARTALADAQQILGYTGAAREYRLMVRVLREMKRYENARRVARALRERYPRSLHNVLPLVGAEWCRGDYVAAAETLREYPKPLTHFDWREEISIEFARCLAERADAAGQAAEQLQLAGSDPNKLKWLARHLHANGSSAAAFAVIERLRAGSAPHQLSLDIEGYEYLAADRGKQAAFEWFEARVPKSMRGPVSELIYWRGQHELLWTLVPDDFSRANHRDAVWMLRAMGLAVGRAYSDERMQRARQYLSEEGETRYADFGRLALGLDEPQSLMDRPLGGQELVETTYALAVRAVIDGEPREALRWFRACVSAGERYAGQVEYRWANEVVGRAAPRGAPEAMMEQYGPDYFMPWGPDAQL